MSKLDDILEEHMIYQDNAQERMEIKGVKRKVKMLMTDLANNTSSLGASHPHFANYISSKELLEEIEKL